MVLCWLPVVTVAGENAAVAVEGGLAVAGRDQPATLPDSRVSVEEPKG